MKRTFKLCSYMLVMLIVASLMTPIVSCVTLQSSDGADYMFYTAQELSGIVSVGGNVESEFRTDSGTPYIRVTATAPLNSATATYAVFNFYPAESSESAYLPDFKVADYPIIAIKYRTDIVTKDSGLGINAGIKIGDLGYKRCWGMKGKMTADSKYHVFVFDLRKFGSYDGGQAKWEDIDPNSGVKYIRIPMWAYSNDLALATEEFFDIESIAFFKSESDASKYAANNEDSSPAVSYTITFKTEDGKVIESRKLLGGARCVVTEVPAPEKEGFVFTGWKDADGNIYTGGMTVNSDMVLTPAYSSNENHSPFINGYEGHLFKPDNNMTRAEACAVVTRLLVDETTIKGKNTSKFVDAESGAWYYDYVAYLENNGYLDAYEGTFSPNQPITRAEFVELVYNMGKVSDTGKTLTFKDVDASHPRYKVIMAAASAGLVNGRDDGTFDPDGTIKRSEVVKVLCAALGRTPAMSSFDDISAAGFVDVDRKHWAYPYIIEASVEHQSRLDQEGVEIWTSAVDSNTYINELPEGTIEKLDAAFMERVKQIRATESEWELGKPSSNVYYVSNSGDDSNRGTSPEKALKTIEKVMQYQTLGYISSGDVVLFERGGEWHENLKTLSGVTYSAYGEGDKPRILGSVEADNAEQWILTDAKNVYKFNEPLTNNQDVGNIVFDHGKAFGQRIIKAQEKDVCLPAGRDNIVSNGISFWEFPAQAFSGYKDLADIGDRIPEADFMYYHDRENSVLYLYSRNGNPGDLFESIEICKKGNTINGAYKDVTYDNLFVGYCGSHGIGMGTSENITVRNCEIGWIGGSVQGEDVNTRFGNAVEIYGAADGFYVYNNLMYQCFDCGPTVQVGATLTSGKKIVQKDVAFYGNALWEASLEVWLTTSPKNTEDTYSKLINCRMYDNYVTMSGYGWKGYNHQKNEYCSFYGATETGAELIDCYMENNYFWNLRRYFAKAVATSVKDNLGFKWINNTIIMKEGGKLAQFGLYTDTAKGGLTTYDFNEETIKRLVADGTLGYNTFYSVPSDYEPDELFPDIFK